MCVFLSFLFLFYLAIKKEKNLRYSVCLCMCALIQACVFVCELMCVGVGWLGVWCAFACSHHSLS